MAPFTLAVLVSGRGSNLQAIIDSIEKKDLPAEIGLVVSNVKDAYALERAQKQGIESIFMDPKSYPDRNSYEQALVERIQAKSVNLICLAGFMRVLGKHFIETFSGRIINIHPSLLPAFPGSKTGFGAWCPVFRMHGTLCQRGSGWWSHHSANSGSHL